jgi:hypothetical protein
MTIARRHDEEHYERVYLLGAGFSMAVSANVQYPQYRMPTMGDLSDAVLDDLRSRFVFNAPTETLSRFGMQLSGWYESSRDGEIPEEISEQFREFADAAADFVVAQRLPGAGTPIVKNFEQWLSYLVESPPWLSPSDQAVNRSAFLNVAQAVSSVLESRQRLLLVNQWKQELRDEEGCPAWLKRLVKEWEHYSAKVITFNYDQLVELAWLLHGNAVRSTPFVLTSRDLYPALLTPLTARGGGGNFRGPHLTSGGLELLKLHGSLGWYYSDPDGPPGDIVYDQGVAGGSWMADGVFASDAHELTAAHWADLQPMIVPPATVKSPYYANNTLRSLWTRAALHLRNAKELVIMGFSLPATDMLVSSMLATTIAPDCVITPVDYSPDIVKRICDTFDIKPDSPRLNRKYAGQFKEHEDPQWVEDENAIPRWVNDCVHELIP